VPPGHTSSNWQVNAVDEGGLVLVSLRNIYHAFFNVHTLNGLNAAMANALNNLEILRAYHETFSMQEVSQVPGRHTKNFRLRVTMKQLHLESGYSREGRAYNKHCFPIMVKGSNADRDYDKIGLPGSFLTNLAAGMPFHGERVEKFATAHEEFFGFSHQNWIVVPLNKKTVASFTPFSPLRPRQLNELVSVAYLYHAKKELLDKQEQHQDRDAVSPKELECIRWLAAGKSLQDVSDITNMPYRTVRYHLDNARTRYGYSTNMQLVVRAAKDYGLSPL
jgi:DNA-binding CsgD family transcriptional regulator